MMEIATVIALMGFPRKARTPLRLFSSFKSKVNPESSVRIIEVVLYLKIEVDYTWTQKARLVSRDVWADLGGCNSHFWMYYPIGKISTFSADSVKSLFAIILWFPVVIVWYLWIIL